MFLHASLLPPPSGEATFLVLGREEGCSAGAASPTTRLSWTGLLRAFVSQESGKSLLGFPIPL